MPGRSGDRSAGSARRPADQGAGSTAGDPWPSAHEDRSTFGFPEEDLAYVDDLFDAGHAVFHDPLDARLERLCRRGAAHAGALQFDLDDPGFLVDVDEPDVTFVGLDGRAHDGDDFLDPRPIDSGTLCLYGDAHAAPDRCRQSIKRPALARCSPRTYDDRDGPRTSGRLGRDVA